MMFKRSVALLLLVLLIACGETPNPTPTTPNSPNPNTGTISGTITFAGASALTETEGVAANRTAPVMPGEIIVRFAPGIRAQALSSLRVQGYTLERERSLLLDNSELYKVEGLSQAETFDLAETLKARPDVADAVPNYLRYPLATPNDPNYNKQWHYPAMNLPAAWDITTGSANVVVAVIDTGILAGHPDFGNRLLPGYDFVSDLASANDGDGRDSNPNDPGVSGQTFFHGTHVAGTIGAATNNGVGVAGVDWKARVLPVRAIGVKTGTLADIMDATLWAAGLEDPRITGIPKNQTPADVLNLSLGGPGPCEAMEQEIYNRVIAAGKIIVVAAGNGDENQRPEDARFVTPANCDNVITVGATDRQGNRAFYSNFGPRIDIMAPGGENAPDAVLSLSKNASNAFDYVFSAGTSMATPHVAGVAALMKALQPAITQDQVRQALTSSARPLSTAQCVGGETFISIPSGSCGAGLIDAAKALEAVTNPPTPNPPPTPTPVDLAGTQVFACSAVVNNTCTIAQQVTVTGQGQSVSYTFKGLAAGNYIIVAWQDVNTNQQQDIGDIEGNSATVTAPASGVDFTVTKTVSSASNLSIKAAE